MKLFAKKSALEKNFERARKEGWALGQFNFSTLEQLRGIMKAGEEFSTPVICGTSEGEAGFFGIKEAAHALKVGREKCNAEFFLNFDHGKSFETVKEAVDTGYDMVHFDGSHLSLEENIKETRRVVSYARKRGVLVEGEVSKIEGKSASLKGEARKTTLTSLEKVAKFIERTGVDCIALDVGNVHGVYPEMPRLYLERIDELLKRVSCFVVLHGGSGVDEVKIREAVSRGVVKVNINTELRVSWKEALKKSLAEKGDEVAPYKLLPPAGKAVQEKVEEKIKLLSNV